MLLNKKIVEKKLSLVIQNQMNLERPSNECDLMKDLKDGGESIGIFRRDFGMEEWEWPQGVGLYGLNNFYKCKEDKKILEFVNYWYKNHISKGLPIRNINTTAPLLALSMFNDVLQDKDYDELCKDWAEWIINSLEKTEEGGFQHTVTNRNDESTVRLNNNEVWIDTLFMTILFLTNMGVKEDNKEWLSESIHQILLHIKYLYCKEERLFYHGWSFNDNNNFAGVFWCRGNSWFTSGLVEYIEICGDKIDEGLKKYLIDTFKAQVNRLVDLQQEDGLWNTILDDETTYKEVSGSAGIAFGILKGIRLGILSDKYKKYAEKAIKGVINNIDENGTVLNVSAGTAMGYTRDHYKNIIIAPMAYGQSLAIMALSEYLLSN